MKKIIIMLVVFVAVLTVNAQTAVVVERPGLLTDLATAVVGVPAAAATGLVTGTINAVSGLVSGSTVVVPVTPPLTPIVVPQPRVPVPPAPPVVLTPSYNPGAVVIAPQVVTERVTVSPWGSSAVVTTPTVVGPQATVTTVEPDGTVVTVTRGAGAYELGPVPVAPVDAWHRVSPSPYANPYIYRHRP